MNTDNTIINEITRRANRLKTANLGFVLNRRPFYLAGGALGRNRPNDFDLYPADGEPFDLEAVAEAAGHIDGMKVVSTTRNAMTVELNGQVLQLCQYQKGTLGALLASFDFAHCQVGAEFEADESGGDFYVVTDVRYTQDWLRAKALESTFFTGSAYPLASLLRTFKYAKREMFVGRSYLNDVLAIVEAVVHRGFEDYGDFKDQLDAIDLAYSDTQNAWSLFKECWNRGLVRSRTGLTPEQEKELE